MYSQFCGVFLHFSFGSLWFSRRAGLREVSVVTSPLSEYFLTQLTPLAGALYRNASESESGGTCELSRERARCQAFSFRSNEVFVICQQE
jgi:hypothetical protein